MEEQAGSRIAAAPAAAAWAASRSRWGRWAAAASARSCSSSSSSSSPRGGGGGLGVDPGTGQFAPAPGASSTDLDKAPADDPAKFIDFVAGDVDATWKKIFSESGKTYEQPVIVLYDNGVQSACGNTPSTVGPFYCPRDHKVYIWTSRSWSSCSSSSTRPATSRRPTPLRTKSLTTYRASGNTEEWRRERENRRSQRALGAGGVQADCSRGLGASTAARARILEPGDLEEGLRAA